MSRRKIKGNTYKFDGEYAYILLSKGEVKIDIEDYDKINKYTWYINKYGYVESGTLRHKIGKQLRLHRFIMNCPEDKVVDHIDHDPLNNTKNNLRVCTSLENNINSRRKQQNTLSKYKGVTYCKNTNKWRAKTKKNGKTISLGYFKTEEEAFLSYKSYMEKEYEKFSCFIWQVENKYVKIGNVLKKYKPLNR